MARQRFLGVAVLLSLFTVGSAADDSAKKPVAKLSAGAATSNITPPLGGDVVGGFHPFPATHIHDELHARCLVLDNGQTRVAIVVCDLLGASREMYDEARRLVQHETGIPGGQVLMSSTHTHSAVSALGVNRFKFEQELSDYQKFVARRIADGVRRAIKQLVPAQIGWASASNPRQVFNRRWFMKPGTVPPNPFGQIDQVKMNPPRGSSNLLEPAGPIDPEIALLSVQTHDGKPLAVFANYSLHYVGGVPEGHVSADYFALFCEQLAERLGADKSDPPFVAMLANGTSGNINNINFRVAGESKPPYGKMREVAADVAESAAAALVNVKYQHTVALGGELRELSIGTRRPTVELLAWAKTTLDAKPADRKATLEEIYAERTQRMNEYPEQIDIPLQVLRVGDVGITAISCEVFVEIGLELKERSPLKPAFTVSIANGYFGYLPTPEHHRLGGYETWLGTNRLEVNASTKIVDELLRMLERVKNRR